MPRGVRPPNPRLPSFSPPLQKITCPPPPRRLSAGAGPGDARAGCLCQHRKGCEEAQLEAPSEVKPQSLCPFPRDGWSSRPGAMIMRLEFDREASNRKTYGVNLDALRLAHTRERAAQSPAGPPATPRPSGPASQAAVANAQRCAPRAGPAREPTAGKPELQGENPAARGGGQKPLPRQGGSVPGLAGSA